MVAFGQPSVEPDGWQVPVKWRSATFVPLFPMFAGYLEVSSDRVAIHGRTLPRGDDRQSVDAAVLHIPAVATACWFLGFLATALA